MARNLSAKCKQCRREGTKLFLKGERCFSSKCAMVKRNYLPGLHGPKNAGRPPRLTSYGTQLREKQKAKRTYRLLEDQFHGYFEKAIRKAGDTGENLFSLLEMRLDNAIYRAGFTTSRDAARQLINHGHFLVNGKKVDIPSYQVKIKDKITIKKKSLESPVLAGLAERLKDKEISNWLAIDLKTLEITVIDEPKLEKDAVNFDLKLIIEFYSR